MRIVIRVQPGARSPSVGGDYEGALVVRVPEVAEKGRATAAALRAVAKALGVRMRDVRLVAGGSSRRKTIEIDFDFPVGDPRRARAEQAASRRVVELRQAPDAHFPSGQAERRR
jgi:uncharacterized protein YggU (UPF0235/DUF167 family)